METHPGEWRLILKLRRLNRKNEAHQETKKQLRLTLELLSPTVQDHHGEVEAHPGAVEIHPGAMDAHCGAVQELLDI
jgi:hypothetical protein